MVTATEPGSSHTNWSMIFDAARGDDLPATTAMEQLVRRYWPAVYAFIRKTGRDVHQSADLTQGFVCDVILGRGLLVHADPARGRFRSLLLKSLQNYLREQHRHQSSTRRSPAIRPLQLQEADLAAAESDGDLTPEQAFVAQWNATLIRRVLESVRDSCRTSAMEAHWAVFEARVVRPLLFNEPRIAYATLVERLNLRDAGQAANMMIVVKRRFVQLLEKEVGCTVGDPMQVEDEIRTLLRELERQS